MEKLKITKKTSKPFKGDEGQEIKYFWYKAVRAKDGVTLEFGSKSEHEVGDEMEIMLEKSEIAGGRFRYKEISLS